jgi:hypothetical protein
MATKRPSFLKRQKEQKRAARALEKREARRARRDKPGDGSQPEPDESAEVYESSEPVAE